MKYKFEILLQIFRFIGDYDFLAFHNLRACNLIQELIEIEPKNIPAGIYRQHLAKFLAELKSMGLGAQMNFSCLYLVTFSIVC